MRKGKKGFTIIELIVVMTIIMMLAGLVAAAASTARQRALIARTRAMIAGIETGLGMFQSDVGGYPLTGNTNLFICLMSNTGNYFISTSTPLPNTNWAGPYMTFKDNDLAAGPTIVDAWGTAYLYSRPDATHGNTYVDIRSAGPDKTYGNADDITNWTR